MTKAQPDRLVGCIADDYTGATDIASVLRRSGYTTRVYFDMPRGDVPVGIDAVVVALKIRTTPVDDALRQTRAVLRWMREQSVWKYVVKYCSTMDSTARGNIGPVVDAVMQAEDQQISIVVPSYPDNGRTVRDGVLYVDGTPLAQSSMRNHPITPMTESEVREILRPQTRARVSMVDLQRVRDGRTIDTIRELRDVPGPHLVVVDAVSNDDIRLLRDVVEELPVVTGGAALALALPRPPPRSITDELFSVSAGYRLILSGSASTTTQAQVRHAMDHMTALRLDPHAGSEDQVGELVEQVTTAWKSDPEQPVLIYATVEPADIRPGSASAVEETFGALATLLISAGARQLVVAGGETSGAIVQRLGISCLDLGPVIAPGILWGAGVTDGGVAIDLALKSGNFGSNDMFTTAWRHL